MEEEMKGRCLCGKIQFSASPPVLFNVHCHCNFCRQAQGAAFVTWVGVKEERFRYVAGGDQITWYRSTRESSRGFCPTCGSTMFFRSSVAPDEIHIARPYIFSSIDKKPTAHVFFDHHVDWIEINDNLEKIESDNQRLAEYQNIGSTR